MLEIEKERADAEYSIGELASEFDVTPRAIRFYEAEGLLAPRREGQRRIYAPRDRTRLKLTLRGKRLGLSLEESAEIVRLAEHDGELLHWYYDEGLVPGTKVELLRAEPAAGQFALAVEGADRAIGEKAAAGLFVRPAA